MACGSCGSAAVEDPDNKSISDISNASFFNWENSLAFQSVPTQFLDKLFSSGTRTANFVEKNLDYSVADSNITRNVVTKHYGEDASFGLSVSNVAEDSDTLFNLDGIKKVKDSEVKDSDHILHASNGENNHVSQSGGRDDYLTSVSMGKAYNEENSTTTSIRHTYEHGNRHSRSLDSPYCEGDVGDSHMNEAANLISFSGFPDEQDIIPVGKHTGQYDKSCSQPLQAFEAFQVAKTKAESASKHKGCFNLAKKEAPNSFPSNVRSLISTGMLDGVPVKYVSLQQKELRGIIKGSGYLCGCQTCDYTKILNAYEFERHSGCKTKHPNNHIYFENGKTIYQIVQELRSTPESLLFDTIQTVFGAQINLKSFRTWKESFQAASRELQRIYGKDKVNF